MLASLICLVPRLPLRRIVCGLRFFPGNVSSIRNTYEVYDIIINQVFFLRTIDLKTSCDVAETGEYPIIIPKWCSPAFKICVLRSSPIELISLEMR